MYNQIKNLSKNSDKIKFVLNFIFEEHKNLSERVSLIGQMTPYKNMEIDDDFEKTVNGLLGYLIYIKKYSLPYNDFVLEAKKVLFQYLKNPTIDFKIKRYSHYLNEI